MIPSTRPSGKGIFEIAHRDYAISIQPDAPSGESAIWDINPEQIGAWLEWIAGMLYPSWDEPPLIDRRDYPEFSVGDQVVQPVPEIERDELSDLVIAESPLGDVQVLGEPPVVVVAADWTIADVGGIAVDWFDYWDKADRGIFVLPPDTQTTVLQETLQKADEILLTPIGDVEVEDVVSFFDDLGDVIVGTAQSYLTGLVAPQPGATFLPSGFTEPIGPAPAPMAAAPVGAACDTGPSPVYKKVCGVYKWVYPKRRRRRQLLTESDYNGLLRIESLKVNKNMTVAIAKALTR